MSLMGAAPVIDVKDVTRSFGAREALRGVSLTVSAGEIHGLIGPNGAGKSTLLRILAGIVAPTSGTATVAGLASSDSRLPHRIGLVPAGPRSFYLRLSGLENLIFFGRLCGLRKRAARERALAVLEQVGLQDAAEKRVGLYSGGMQRRLAVARALLGRPPVLLVDEATHDLDVAGAAAIRGLMHDAAATGAAVLWTTQRLEELEGLTSRVTLLQEGEQRFSGTLADMLGHAGGRRYRVTVRNRAGLRFAPALHAAVGGDAELVSNGIPNEYVVALEESISLARLLTSLADLGIDVVSCREEQAPVERAFLSLVAGESE